MKKISALLYAIATVFKSFFSLLIEEVRELSHKIPYFFKYDWKEYQGLKTQRRENKISDAQYGRKVFDLWFDYITEDVFIELLVGALGVIFTPFYFGRLKYKELVQA